MEQKEQTTKYLTGLLYLGIASISLNVVTDILVNDGWAYWLSLLLTGGTAVCLYLLRPACGNYRFAALVRAVCLLLSITIQSIGIFFMPDFVENPEKMQLGITLTRVLGIILSFGSIFGPWLEYQAHGALVSGADPAFQKKWRTLFFLYLGVTLFYSLGTYVAAYLQQLLHWDISTTHALVLAILHLPVKAAYLLYLLYLYRTIRLIRE